MRWANRGVHGGGNRPHDARSTPRCMHNFQSLGWSRTACSVCHWIDHRFPGTLDLALTAHLFLLSASIATRWRYEEKKRLGFAEANDGQEDGKTPWQTAGLRPSQSSLMMQWEPRMGSHCIVLQCCSSNVRHTCLRDRGHGFPYQKYSLPQGCTYRCKRGNVPNWDAEFSRWIPHTRDRSTGPDG